MTSGSDETPNDKYYRELNNLFAESIRSISNETNTILQELNQNKNMADDNFSEQELFAKVMALTQKINNLCQNIEHADLTYDPGYNIYQNLNASLTTRMNNISQLLSSYPNNNDYERHFKVLQAAKDELRFTQDFLNGDPNAGNKIKNTQLKISFLAGQEEDLKKAFATVENSVANLEEGPINKNTYTIQFEEITKAFLQNKPYEQVRIEDAQGNGIYELHINNKKYNLNEILQNTNFAHLTFGETELNAYMDMLASKENGRMRLDAHYGPQTKPPNELAEIDRRRLKLALIDKEFIDKIDSSDSPAENKKALKELSSAERMAIFLYSTDLYKIENGLLRGNIDSALDRNVRGRLNLVGSDSIKDLLCACAIAKAGLAKREVPQKAKITYRGEDELPQEVVRQRAQGIKSQTPIETKGFISSAAEKPVLNFTFNDNSHSKVGVVSELYGIDISPISTQPEEREVLSGGGQVLYEAQVQVGSNESIYKAKKVETLTGLRPEQLLVPKDLGIRELDKLSKLNVKLARFNQQHYELTKKLNDKDKPLITKWFTNSFTKSQIKHLEEEILKLRSMRSKVEAEIDSNKDIRVKEIQSNIDQKFKERENKTDDVKLFNLIEEYNKRIAKNPILDPNQFEAFREIVNKLQLTTNDIVDNQQKAKDFIKIINKDEEFAGLLAKAKTKEISIKDSHDEMIKLKPEVSYPNQQRIVKYTTPKDNKEHIDNQNYFSAPIANNPSDVLSHASKFAKEKDYGKLVELIELSLTHHQNNEHANSIWRFKENEISAMSALLHQVNTEAQNNHSPYTSRLLLANFNFLNEFQNKIDNTLDHVPVHEQHHPESLHMFEHAVSEHKASRNLATTSLANEISDEKNNNYKKR